VKYIVGVDGGGTKTEAVAYSLDGKVLGRGVAGFGNIILEFEEALYNINKAIDKCIKEVDVIEDNNKCVYMFLGIAGVESGNNIEKVEKILHKKYGVSIKVTNDADIAHAALLKGEDGILTISGTGSISYGIYNGKKGRTGGWGHILGDEGSGYYIAMQAFKNITLEDDCNLPISPLSKTIMKKLNINEPNDIKGFIYSSNKAQIAAFVPLVAAMANKNDKESIAILKNAGKELAVNTERLYRKLNISGQIKIGIKGSILTEIKIVREEFENYLKTNLETVVIVNEKVSPTKGAYYLARNLINEN
jgi:N-acetylglucosamine kinase-like BadF-type ATPase